MSVANLYIEPYSDASFLVKGDSHAWKTALKAAHGKWNGTLGGYIFSNRWLSPVQTLVGQINSGALPPSDEVPAYVTKSKPTSLVSRAPVVSTALPGAQPILLPVISKTRTLSYTVHVPAIGDTASIEIDGGKIEAKVSYVYPTGDKLQLSYAGENPITFEVGVYAGNWQARGDPREHKITFQ